MVDQVLRIGVDSSQAEAGARRIIASLRAIQQEAAKAANITIPVKIDTAGIGAAIAEVNQALRGVSNTAVDINIPVGLDRTDIDGQVSDIAREIKDEIDRNTRNGVSVEASLKVVTDAAQAEIDRVISQQIDPIEAALRVDTNAAEAEISQLRRAEQSPIDLKVNVSAEDADSDINRILSGASETVTIPVDVAIQEAQAKIDKLLAKAREDIEVAINVTNATNADDDVGRWRARASRPVTVPVGADTREAEQDIGDLLDKADADVNVSVSVSADTRSAEAAVDNLLSEANRAVNIPVSADTAQAKAAIDQLRDDLSGVGLDGTTVRLDADASDVVREAGRAEDAIRQVGDAADDLSRTGGIDIDMSSVAADSAKAAAGLDKINDNAKKAAVSAKDMGDAFSSALQGEEALELLGEALLAIATSIGTAIIAFEGYQDAVETATGSTAAAEMALAMLEEFALSTAFSIEDVTNAFVKLRGAGLEASKEALTSYGNVAAGLNITMEELASAVGDAAEGNFSKLNDTQLKAVESGDRVKFTYQGVTTEVQNTGKAVAGFIKQMGDTKFAGQMEDAAGGVTGAFEAMSDAWKELARDMGEGGLSQGMEDFAQSMVRASEAADELGRLLGSWLGAEMTALGRFIETTVREIDALIDIFESLIGVMNSVVSASDALSSVGDFIKGGLPNLFVERPDEGEQQGPPEDPATVAPKAFGTDTNLPRKPKRKAKTKEQKQAENFAEQTANNKELIRTLTLMDEAYDRGRISVEGFRNSVEELNIRQAAQKSVGKENAEAIVEQAMAIKYLEESMAFKAEVLGQQEAIVQTVELAEAYKSGTDAVEQAQAKQEAYNTAVKLGGVNMPGLIDQLTELAAAAKEANDNLKLEESLFDLDQEIESVAKMATAYREGGGAVREAALEQQVYAAALAAGEADEEDSIARIREKMTALRDLQEIQQADERAMMAGFDLEQMEGELRISQMVGEARYIEAERLEMLTQKKRETKDATAELTAEEERLAEAMGRATAAMAGQSSALDDLANSIPNIAYAFEEATASGLMHFEDALVSIVTGTKSAREAFADMAKSIAADLARMAIRMAIIQPLAMMFGGMGGMAGGMVATGAPMALGGVYHTGGIVGADPVPTRSFGTLPKFHTGGIVGADDTKPNPHPFATFPKFHTGGLASSETPAVLQKGEGVFTKNQMAALAPVNNNDMSAPVTINVSVQQTQGGDPAAAENQGRIIAKQVQMAMGDYISKAQRNGGQLNPNGGY